MTNRSTGKNPFSILYSKPPSFTVDLVTLPSFRSKASGVRAEEVQNMSTQYKLHADAHRRKKTFQEGDLVLAHLSEARLLAHSCHKLNDGKFDPVRVVKRINDNAYILDLPSDTSFLHFQCQGHF